MKLSLPLSNHPPRTMTLERNPRGWLFPRVLQIELLHEAEAAAITAWLSERARITPDQIAPQRTGEITL